ncbi:HlyD family secretion protein [Sphingobacterium multivorum]|uniref:HlyD family secretion protein n=1 Tax=Sphingobacterium multivorum TaxID=28454 RepID=UPI0028AB25DA|nr:HlyD family efflux transporter periplasmic adaptor subunit [Sphingobacterium multivorum]
MEEQIIIESESHSEDLQEIITKPPSWLLRWGISCILFIVVALLGISCFIRYPEMIDVPVKFNTEESPKFVSAKVSGNLVKLFLKDGSWVTPGTPLAYLESTADHDQVLSLLGHLYELQKNNESPYDLKERIMARNLNLGELQESYHTFYLAYLNYLSSRNNGIFQKRRIVINKEVANVNKQYEKSNQSFQLQKQQLKLAEQDYEKYKLLAEKKVISPAELQEKETLLLSKRQIIPQMENNLISYEGNIISKHRELADIENQITEEQKKFIQSLNSFISDAENWKKQYVIVSFSEGKLIYSEFLQVNQSVSVGQKLFYINPKNEQYYGELTISQDISAKVRLGQQALIKVRSYPYGEYGYLRGRVSYISEIPIRDSTFFVKLDLLRSGKDSLIQLKPGILGNAEIITEDKSIFKRVWDNLTKNLEFQ